MSNFGTFSGKERGMRIKTRLRPFIYMDDVRHEIISQRGTVGVLIGAKIGNTGYCVIAVQKDP